MILSFHNDVAIKEKYLSRVIAHQNADNLTRGTGWNNGRGCAIGCTLESYDHSRYPIELGIPVWLAHVKDDLFERMTKEKSRTWPEEVLRAIPVGVDLEQIKSRYIVMICERALTRVNRKKRPSMVKTLDRTIALWKRDDIGSDAFNLEAASLWALDASWVASAADDWQSARASECNYSADQLLALLREAK